MTGSAIWRGSSTACITSPNLGVDAIWISPFFRSPMLDFGYDVSDYRDVDPMFGTLGDFDALIHAPMSWG
jgi:maltooligosyltrehalose synthase